jgi:hypothetical protein
VEGAIKNKIDPWQKGLFHDFSLYFVDKLDIMWISPVIFKKMIFFKKSP